MPLTVVQGILGHKSADLTAQYLKFTSESVRRMVQQHIRKEAVMKTSARNSFTGQVTAIRQDGLLAEVELTTSAGYKVVSVITEESFLKLGVTQGKVLTATIKAPLVIIVKEPQAGKTSMRNRFHGKIARINTGKIAAEVVVTLPDGTDVCALITDESVKKLDLKVGDEVWTMCKAFSVVLNAD
jgi:molybdate transport system regulatory protein